MIVVICYQVFICVQLFTRSGLPGARQVKLYHPAYADSKDPDQTAQPSDQGLRYPFSESLDVVECINQKRGGNFRYDFVDARDLKNCAFRNMLEDTVSLDTTNLHVAKLKVLFTVCNRQNAFSNVCAISAS